MSIDITDILTLAPPFVLGVSAAGDAICGTVQMAPLVLGTVTVEPLIEGELTTNCC